MPVIDEHKYSGAPDGGYLCCVEAQSGLAASSSIDYFHKLTESKTD